MKHREVFLVGMGLAAGILFSSPASAEVQEELFSTQGTVTSVDSEKRILRVRSEAGLEFTFRADSVTQIREGEEPKTFADLAAEEEVEIEYLYNENYEKIARRITKVKKARDAPQKSEGPAS